MREHENDFRSYEFIDIIRDRDRNERKVYYLNKQQELWKVSPVASIETLMFHQ